MDLQVRGSLQAAGLPSLYSILGLPIFTTVTLVEKHRVWRRPSRQVAKESLWRPGRGLLLWDCLPGQEEALGMSHL